MSGGRIVPYALWAPVSPTSRNGNRFIDWASMSPTRKGVIENLDRTPYKINWDTQKARGWTIEKVTVSGGWE